MSAVVLQVEWAVGNGSPEPTLAKLTTAIERAGIELLDVGTHVLPKLIPVLEGETAKQFDAQGGGPISGSWAPLSQTYAAWKEKHHPGLPINVLSGKLRRALTGPGANSRREVFGDSLVYGTEAVPYASVKQTGSPREPARPPFDFGSTFERSMQRATAAGVREAIKAGSGGALETEGDE